jgi:hypothetical protein
MGGVWLRELAVWQVKSSQVKSTDRLGVVSSFVLIMVLRILDV